MPQPTHHKAWQRHWHDVFDAALGPDDKEPPENVDEDLRLQFEFASLDAEARRRAFSVFPRHEEMLARLQQYQSTPARAIGPDEAVQLLRDGLSLVEPMGLDVPDADGSIEVLDTSATTLLKAFSEADSPFIELHDALGEMALRETGEAGQDAYHFLVEPLYRLETSYPILHWVLWPLCAPPGAPDATEADYRLWRGGWSAGWGRDRVFVFDRRKEFGLA